MLTLDLLRGVNTGRWLALALLLTLHGALWIGLDHPLARPLLFIHLGLFLLWQPLWRSEVRLSRRRVLAILACSLLALSWLSTWLMVFWVAGLFALVGARAFTYFSRWVRAFHLLMLSYLLALLLLYLAPHLFELPELREVTANLMNYGLPSLLLLMAALPAKSEQGQTVQAVDFFYVIMLFMLVIVLVLGSLALMTLKHIDYLSALLGTLTFMAAALLILGALWRPQSGFGGFAPFFSRYILSIGTPLEGWLQQLASDAREQDTPQNFLQSATIHLAAMPGVAGLAWNSNAGHGNLGESSPHRVEIADRDLSVTLFMRAPFGPGVLLHMRLLVRVLGEVFQGKRREQQLRENTRQQALYETGARLTHDLKNMLQSLFALTSIAQHEPAKAQPILQRQLPQLTRRIETLLVKLKMPGDMEEVAKMSPLQWWERLRQRHSHRRIDWKIRGEAEGEIPAELFDCVADNLIENAGNKRLRETAIRIAVSFDAAAHTFSVGDNGSAIAAPIAQNLLHTVVPSEDGLGVGLYQAARWAQQQGWQLQLVSNQPGEVRFELKPLSG